MNKLLCKTTLVISMLVFNSNLFAQEEDLLKLLGEEKPKKERIKYAFKSPRVINSHSMEFLNPGTMDFRILHRFGELNQKFFWPRPGQYADGL